MKNNTQQSKHLLAQALAALPQDEVLQEARSYMRAALDRIEHVEKKRGRRAAAEAQVTADSTWWNTVQEGALRMAGTTPDVSQQLAARCLVGVNRLIQIEQDKLDAISAKHAGPKVQKGQHNQDGNDGDVHTIHG